MSMLKWITSPLLSQVHTIRHGLSTRHGGTSAGPFSSLNLGLHVGDDPDAVLENRRRVCTALGFDLPDWVSGEQVHGASVAVVERADRGRGAFSWPESLPGVDGLVTDQRGTLLAAFFADCVPLMLVDPKGPRVALGHAGWRGTLANIAAKLVHALKEAFGTNPADLLAWIGPSIGPCCFHVSPELAARFARDGYAAFVTSGSEYVVDLQGINRRQLENAGVPSDHIDVSTLCTSCRTDQFFSYRAAGGQTGRMAALLGIPS